VVDGARRRLPQDGGYVERAHALDHVGARAGEQGGVYAAAVFAGREGHRLDFGPQALDLGDALQAVAAGHAQVEQNEVGRTAIDEGQELVSRAGLADDFDAVALLERPAEPLKHERMIIRD
jgi:hypothetical protein